MPDLDALAPNYRRAQQRWPDAPTLAMGHEALRVCFDTSTHGLVEHVKSFIESVCLTVMGELREPMPSSPPSTTDLLVAALNPLGLRNTRGAAKLDKVLSSFNRLADALTEMRNENGPVAHGRDAFLDALTTDHARAFLHAGDAILGVLLNALEGKQPDLTVTREPYESFQHLNARIDRAVSVEVRIDDDGKRPMVVFAVAAGPRAEAIELRVEPSRLLYGVDRRAYIEVLRTAESLETEVEDAENDEGDAASGGTIASPGFSAAAVAVVLTDIVADYIGPLEVLRVGLGDFLKAKGLDPTKSIEGGTQLADSLLSTAERNMGLDWRQRGPLQARLKVALKRVLVQFGSAPEEAATAAGQLVVWLRVQAPEIARTDLAGPTGMQGSPA